MHASAFLIRETKIRSSLRSVFRLEFLWELVIREGRFWNFYGGVVTRRHSFGFFGKRQKWKILIFRFCCYQGFRDEVPNKSSYQKSKILYIQMRLACFKHPLESMVSAPFGNRFLGSFRRNAEACITSLLFRNEKTPKGFMKLSLVIFGRINIFSVFRSELERYSRFSNVLHLLRGRNHFFRSDFIFRLENPL